ncbi:hypothetical protein XM57_21980 [Burkholderia cepacia]|nr:hypothetical protein AK34_4687 [Burkholderia dolosa AU0158]AKE05345.1 hypothetical protein XM57_21980 [Burkholderia cepacia]VWB96140.1 hypothetical protein BDO18943_04583 [Burkholderia dolosa]
MQVTRYINDLAVRVRKAMIARDFDSLAMIDREAHLVATELAGKKLDRAACSALMLLAASHREATKMLEDELRALTREMTRVSERRAGCRAYARQNGELDA